MDEKPFRPEQPERNFTFFLFLYRRVRIRAKTLRSIGLATIYKFPSIEQSEREMREKTLLNKFIEEDQKGEIGKNIDNYQRE